MAPRRDRLDWTGLRVQLGRDSTGCSSTPYFPGEASSRRTIPFICPGARDERIRPERHGTGRETRHHQRDHRTFPQIGTFTMFEMPTGSYNKGLGVGKVWYKLPVWLQKNSGKWLFDGGLATRWFRRQLSRFSLHRLVGETGAQREAGVGRGIVRPWARRLCRGADWALGDDRRGRLLPFQAS
jgi:hypothetical protein